MFVLKKVYIENYSKTILDVSFSDDKYQKATSKNFISLIIGENGVGKSFLLKSLVEIFLFLEKIPVFQRKPKYRYEKFVLEYFLGDDLFSIQRNSGVEIYYKKNKELIDYEDLVLPQRMLAVSFMVNDKFFFSKNDKKSIYKYLGVRASTNSTYTSSITNNIIQYLIYAVNSGYLRQIEEMLSLIKFDSYLEIEYKDPKSKIVFKDYIIDFEDEEVPNIADIEGINPTVYFKKENERITFDLCSSGEKHILFAFSGILTHIKDNSLVLIDEPEISLHPEWQIQYISTLNKLFSRYKNCHFIIASHSHYFVSNLQPSTSSIVAFRREERESKAELINYSTFAWSAENIIYNVFGVRTTRNYYFENDLASLLELMENYDGQENERINIEKYIRKLSGYIVDNNDPLKRVIDQAEGLL